MNFKRLCGMYFSEDKENLEKEEPESAGLCEKKLSIQRKEHKYHRFVEGNLIVKSGLLDKKKVRFSHVRINCLFVVFGKR